MTGPVHGTLELSPYLAQCAAWPASGRHIMAQFDANSIIVYQAYRPEIADEAVARGRFGPTFSRTRMSWIKPNFLWMMYRSGWGTKEHQERVLAIRIKRLFFERLLASAVSSRFEPDAFKTREAWQRAVAASDVRLQWDPDHDPSGEPSPRRAIQLGLRGKTLEEYVDQAIVELADVTPFVVEQHAHAVAPFTDLVVPVERAYVPADRRVVAALGLD